MPTPVLEWIHSSPHDKPTIPQHGHTHDLIHFYGVGFSCHEKKDADTKAAEIERRRKDSKEDLWVSLPLYASSLVVKQHNSCVFLLNKSKRPRICFVCSLLGTTCGIVFVTKQ